MLRQMQITIKTFLLIFLFTFFGCLTNTSFLPTNESAKYAPTESIKAYWEKPEGSYIIIGRVTAEGEELDEETLFKGLKQKAIAVGAHAIIMGDTSRQSSVTGTTMYGGGTLIVTMSTTRLEAIAIRFAD